jgi:hypothetical protein
MTTARRHARASGAVLALVLIAGAGGCAWLGPEIGPNAASPAGRVEMDWRSRRNLRLVAHDFRRGPDGRLVVTATFANKGGGVYTANLRVKFADKDGLFERGSHEAAVHRFPPGETSLEWTSSTAAAQRYAVDVWSARWLQW